jgi:DNA helicase-2/ATP-dependent DNA helicase PcrA
MVVSEAFKQKLSRLNKPQLEAVEYQAGPLLILAGAGSGKTRVLTHKIAWLIRQQNLAPQHIFAATFTNKAAKEMQTRVTQLLNASPDFLWIGTFHSLFARVLRVNASAMGLTSSFSIYDRDDSLNLIKQWLRETGQKELIKPAELLHKIGWVKNQFVVPEDSLELFQNEKRFVDAYRWYENNLRNNNAVDFDDLLIKPLRIFTDNPGILKKYQQRFRYILIDEYQDTNDIQFQLAALLAADNGQICVVGDEDQSIYGWRGAKVENILQFSEQFDGAKIIRLEENYRSYSAILNVANSVVANNSQRLGKTLFSQKGEGQLPIVWECQSGISEAIKAVGIIAEERHANGYDLNDFAILYRTNAQSRVIEDQLLKNGISYTIIGGFRFFERREVKDAIAYLTLLINPRDMLALSRVINVPKRGIGEKTLSAILQSRQQDDADAIAVLENYLSAGNVRKSSRESLQKLQSILTQYRPEQQTDDDLNWIEQFFRDTGLLQYYEAIDEEEVARSSAPEDYEYRVDRLYALIDLIRENLQNEDNGMTRITDVLEYLNLQTDIDNWNSNDKKVTLMTVHQSKGLEFPVVLICGLEQGLLPLSRSFDEPDDLEEERRLFYVAATRAEDKLYLLHARKRFFRGDERMNLRSQFIDEIDDGLVSFESELDAASKYNSVSNFDNELTYEPDADLDGLPAIETGTEVHHHFFGRGKVIRVEGFGKNARITVYFYKDKNYKKLIYQFANLSLVE